MRKLLRAMLKAFLMLAGLSLPVALLHWVGALYTRGTTWPFYVFFALFVFAIITFMHYHE